MSFPGQQGWYRIFYTMPQKGGSMLLYHIVKAGETLWRIAMSHNVGVQDLKKQNNLISDRIRPGQKLLLPRDSNAIVAVEVWAKLRP